MPSPRIVCVLGMHRAGTSALARSLMCLDVGLGDNLLAGGEDNPKGFFEDLDVLSLNEKLLERIGLNWASITLIDPKELTGEKHADLFEKAVNIVNEHTSKLASWGFKDPRVSRLLPFWQKVFEHLGLSAAYLICLRNPISVARSLRTRNNFPATWSHLMWLLHYYSAFRNTEGKPSLVVDYDLLLSEPRMQIERIASFLGRGVDEFEERIRSFANDFLDSKLCHSRIPETSEKHDYGVPDLSNFHEWALRLANDDPAATSTCADISLRVERSFQSMSGVLELFDNQKSRTDSLLSKTTELEEAKSFLKAEAANLKAWNNSLESGFNSLRSSLIELQSAKDSAIASLQTDIRTLHSQINLLGDENAALKLDCDNQRAEISLIKESLVSRSKVIDRHFIRDLTCKSPGKTWRRISDARLILKSGMFDSEYYLRRYTDVAISGMNPLAHFLLYGTEDYRDPGPSFSTSDYLRKNPDAAASGMNPLVHYIRYRGAQSLPQTDEESDDR